MRWWEGEYWESFCSSSWQVAAHPYAPAANPLHGFYKYKQKYMNNTSIGNRDQRDSRFSRILENFFSFSLLVLDLEPFQFHFHFSKKSEGILFFTFHFSKKVKAIHISLFFLEKKEWNQVRAITSPLSLFPIVFPKIVKSQVSTSLKILAKFQFQNLDQTLCSKSEPNISLKKVTKTRLKFNCAHLRSTKESLTSKYFDTGQYWLVLGQYRTVRVDIW